MSIQNMKKLPIKDILSDPATYIADPGTLTVNLSDFTLSVHNGVTPGGIAVGGGSGGSVAWSAITGKPTFSTVATSGAYSDLSGKPVLSTVATSGLYSDLISKPTFASVATTGAYSDLTGAPVLAAVATTGAYSDLTGKPASLASTILPQADTRLRVSSTAITGPTPMTPNGSEAAPFLTVQAAVDYATTAYPVTSSTGIHIGIDIDPGTYVENVTVTRPLLHFSGFAGRSKGTVIRGNFTINPSVVYSTLGNSTMSMSGLYLSAPSTGAALKVTGSNAITFYGADMIIQAQGTADCLLQDNTAVGGTKLFFNDTEINSNNTTGKAFDVTNCYYFALTQTNVDLGSATIGASLASTGATFSNVFFDGACATLVDVSSGTVSLVNSFVQCSGANSTGFNLGATAILLASQNTFSISAGTGFVVKGVAGSTFGTSFNSMLPGKNVNISSAMTTINLTTSFTAV